MAEKKPYKRLRGNGQGSAYKRGRTWTAVYIYGWIDGKPQKYTKGGFRTKREALEYIPVLKTQNARPTQNPPLKELFDAWCPYYAPRISETTMNGLRSAYKWLAEIEHIPFADLTIDDLQDAVDSCSRGKRTKENIKYLLTQLYKYAQARHICHDNIASFIYCGKETGQTRPPFTPDQVELIRQAIGKIFGADYTYCMIYTGFRPNEMLSLQASAYDPIERVLVGGFKTAAGRNRTVPVSPKIQPIIDRLAARADPWIFPSQTGTLLHDDVFRETIFYPMLDQLGIQPMPDAEHPAIIKPYSCRHTFANLLKNTAGSDTDKAALMGHADASMTKYYQSADLTSLRNIIDHV